MKIFEILLPIAVGALIGYCTNYIAIKMLFLPRKEWHIGKWKVPFTPGVIPKNKSRIASAVANAVSEKLLTESDISEGIKKSGVKEDVVNHITEFVMNETISVKTMISDMSTEIDASEMTDRIGGVLSGKILDGIKNLDLNAVISDVAESSFSGLLSNPMVAMFLGGNAMDTVVGKLANAVTDYVDIHGQELILPMVEREIDSMLSDSLKSNLEQFNIDEVSIRRISDTVIDRIIERYVPGLVRHIQIKDIVEDKINQMDVKDLEDLVMSVMKNELQAVVNLGAVIGAVIGILNIFV